MPRDLIPSPPRNPAATPLTSSPEARILAQRHDGVTPERRRIFIEVLAATGSVAEAARQAGASRQAFYALRTRDDGRDFLRAWDHALALSTQRLCDAAYERAIYGVEEPIFYHGEQIGTRRRYNDRLLMALLRVRARDGFGPLSDQRGWTTVSITPAPSFNGMLASLEQRDGAGGGHGHGPVRGEHPSAEAGEDDMVFGSFSEAPSGGPKAPKARRSVRSARP